MNVFFRTPGSHGSSCPDLMAFGNQSGGLKITGIRVHSRVRKSTTRKVVFSNFQRSGHSLEFTRLKKKKASSYYMIFVQIQLSFT